MFFFLETSSAEEPESPSHDGSMGLVYLPTFKIDF